MELTAVIEALLIASEDPLPSSELARLVRARIAETEDLILAEDPESQLPEELKALADIEETQVTAAINELNQSYETTGRSFLCSERAKGWKIYTRPDYADFVRQLFPDRKPSKLSGPAMETLAIIAYRQPIAKASIEAVRGVSCDGMLQKLLDRELIRIGGRADLPGRPLLYETTDLFFEHFGVKSVDDLPNANELRTVKLPEADFDKETEAKEDIEEQLALTSAGIPLVDSSHTDNSDTNNTEADSSDEATS